MGRRAEILVGVYLKIKNFATKFHCILSSLLFVINNKSYFMTNSDNYSIYTGHSSDLHLPRQTWLFIKKQFIKQMLNSLIVFHQILKTLLAVLGDLKEF
jgi:hypothetical protein